EFPPRGAACSETGSVRSVSIARSHATEACEPRQVRKEAALSNVTRVPWGSLEGAAGTDTVRVRGLEGGCTVALTLDPSSTAGAAARRPLLGGLYNALTCRPCTELTDHRTSARWSGSRTSCRRCA